MSKGCEQTAQRRQKKWFKNRNKFLTLLNAN